jgi:hypothetical protein
LLGLLIAFHIVICCVSLAYLTNNETPFHPRTYHVFYDAACLHVAIPIIAAFTLVSALFLVSSFSFGYFLGFYCYTKILGYLWLNCKLILRNDLGCSTWLGTARSSRSTWEWVINFPERTYHWQSRSQAISVTTVDFMLAAGGFQGLLLRVLSRSIRRQPMKS